MHGRSRDSEGTGGATIYQPADGLLTRVTDRSGVVHAELAWRLDAGGDAIDARAGYERLERLERLVVAGAIVDGEVIEHPLLGAAHRVGETAMSALDWARPDEIPAIAEPASLAPGAGAAILNVIALLAERAGVTALRYAGPYPTAALWRSLLRSFRATGDEAAFTAEALDRALRVVREPIAIDFVPAPHERIAIAGGFVELRDGVERVVLDGVSYAPGGSPARLVDAGAGELAGTGGKIDDAGSRIAGGRHAELWFGDAPYARVATLAADGALVAGPFAIPAYASPVLGRAFPDGLRLAIAELVAEAASLPLADDVQQLCAERPLVWADLGAHAARATGGGFAVHAILWDRIAPLGLGRLALALAEALAPVVTAAAVRRASRQSAGQSAGRAPSGA
jgi:hypothetical protein